MAKFGVDPRNPLEYAGIKMTLVPSVEGNRRPLTTDFRYPLWTEWRVKGPTTDGSTEGEFWKLINFSNGAPNWVFISDSNALHAWTTIPNQGGATYVMESNQRYISNTSVQNIFQLPPEASVGDMIRLVGKGTGGWKITQLTGQRVQFAPYGDTTVGVGGSITPNEASAAIEIVCQTASTRWTVLSYSGTFVVV